MKQAIRLRPKPHQMVPNMYPVTFCILLIKHILWQTLGRNWNKNISRSIVIISLIFSSLINFGNTNQNTACDQREHMIKEFDMQLYISRAITHAKMLAYKIKLPFYDNKLCYKGSFHYKEKKQNLLNFLILLLK